MWSGEFLEGYGQPLHQIVLQNNVTLNSVGLTVSYRWLAWGEWEYFLYQMPQVLGMILNFQDPRGHPLVFLISLDSSPGVQILSDRSKNSATGEWGRWTCPGDRLPLLKSPLAFISCRLLCKSSIVLSTHTPTFCPSFSLFPPASEKWLISKK